MLATATALLVVACTGGTTATPGPSGTPAASTGAGSIAPTQASGDALTVYSGRSESLAGPVFDAFTAATGIPVEVRYADTAELATLLLEEGERSPADVYWAQDGGALGAVAEAGLFAEQPADILERVDERFRSPDGGWVGVSGRARVAAYSTERVEPSELPDSILEFTDPKWSGRLGWVPTNGSFQSFVTALRVLEGEEAARAWLEGVKANEPRVYDGNSAAVEAVAAGEVDVVFVNHYYLLGQIAEQGDDYPVANHFFTGGDPGALVNVAGVGVLASSDQAEEAARFVDHLLSDEAQTYFADETFEYPLVGSVDPDERLPALDEIESPELDLSDISDLEGTLQLLAETGVTGP
jgi:iron(III) transport system substrate-binding protein